MAEFTILHLSDLHFSNQAQKDILVVTKALIDDLKLLKAQNISPNLVIFSGDLVFSGDIKEYEAVNDLLVKPILEIFGLNFDNFVISPGNHDIQRNKVDEIIESGLKQQLVDRISVNKVIDSYPDDHLIYARMQNFENFFGSITNKNLLNHNIHCSIYKYVVNDCHFGIACLNSAWRAYGGSNDYGHLLIGDRTLNYCIERISDCNVKICVVHHPFECLEEFERLELRRLILGSFDFIFTGHNHNHDVSLVQPFNNSQVLMIAGGALYESRDYFNGYSVIQISDKDKAGVISLREYDERSRRFRPAIVFHENGEVRFKLSERQNMIESKDLALFSSLKENLVSFTSSTLLSPQKDGLSKKNFLDIFVPPPLFSESESRLKTIVGDKESNQFTLSIEAIIEDGQNYFVIGGKESGKTSILYYLMLKTGCPDIIEKTKVPIFINFKDIPLGKRRIEKAISDFLVENNIKVDLDDLLVGANWILLVDDFNYADKKNCQALEDFISSYPNGRYIIASNEDVIREIRAEEQNYINDHFKNCYIHSYGRKEIRTLTENYLEATGNSTPGEIADEIIRKMADIHLPATPLIISMMLVSVEKDKNFKPTNKASLVENIIDILLPRIEIQNFFKGSLDFRKIEGFLSDFAILLANEKKEKLTSSEFETFSFNYFDNKGLTISGGVNKLIEYLKNKGILWCSNDQYYFRFKGYKEYFISKYISIDMAKGGVYFANILNDELYLEFASPLEYLSGLQRNNISLLEYLQQKIDENIVTLQNKHGIEKMGLEVYDDFAYTSEISEPSDEDKQKEISKLHTIKLTEEAKDKIANESYKNNSHEANVDDDDDEEKISSIEGKLFGSLLLYAEVIKNCELLENKRVKKEHLLYCIESYLKLVYVMLISLDEHTEEMDKEQIEGWLKKNDKETPLLNNLNNLSLEVLKSIVIYYNHIYAFSLMQFLLCSVLETPQLMVVLEDAINEQTNLLVELLLVKMYSDSKLPAYVDKINSLYKKITKSKNNYYKEILTINLHIHYMYYSMNSTDQVRIEDMLASLVAKKRNLPAYVKSIVHTQIRKKQRMKK